MFLGIMPVFMNTQSTKLVQKAFLVLSLCAFLSGCGLVSHTETSPPKTLPVSTINAQKSLRNSSFQRTATAKAPKQFSLPSVKLVVNSAVKKHLVDFSSKQRRTITKAIEVKNEDAGTVEQIFKDEGVPVELVNLAFIESNFNADAQSPRGARGLWQFMKSTARYYGLKIDIGEDQRDDVILSSLAAAKHLRDLYINYNDWYIALAAYNLGVGGIEKAMQRGKTKDFWLLVKKGLIPKETAQYVPKFVAASLILQDPAKYGFDVSAIG